MQCFEKLLESLSTSRKRRDIDELIGCMDIAADGSKTVKNDSAFAAKVVGVGRASRFF
jgi:hypothetical protein